MPGGGGRSRDLRAQLSEVSNKVSQTLWEHSGDTLGTLVGHSWNTFWALRSEGDLKIVPREFFVA